jgi:hypothetical protein
VEPLCRRLSHNTSCRRPGGTRGAEPPVKNSRFFIFLRIARKLNCFWTRSWNAVTQTSI